MKIYNNFYRRTQICIVKENIINTINKELNLDQSDDESNESVKV